MAIDTVRTRVYPVAARTQFLVYGLICTIAIFFAGAFLVYMARFLFNNQAAALPEIPAVLWASTAALLIGSHLLWRADYQIRIERQRPFRIYLTSAFVLAGVFCVLQAIGMNDLMQRHWGEALHVSGSLAAAALMIFLHVAHFAIGFVALGYVTVQAHQGRYDHEYYNGVRLSAVYWRFLDVIWLIMLLMFCATQL